MRGYKVFKPDWTCRYKKYTCPGEFEEDVEPIECEQGMHFCEKLADCFGYYDFNPDNHVCEVEAYGNVAQGDDKCCTNKLRIIREIPWDEVQRIVNMGKDCTGLCNTGNCNTGDWNTGNRNTGDWNTGDWNTGNRNTGNCNTGNRNTGNWNTGDWNTGNRNTGDWNTGDRNTGNRNTGDCNTGDWNTGNRNTGNRNTGDCNTGDWNTGDWNAASFSSGCFCTEEPRILMFDEPSDMTYRDWINSRARYLLNTIPKRVVEWIYSSDMTDEEKAQHPEYETTGGYLKVLDESECAQVWWDGLGENDRDFIRSIPNFNAKKFEKCTGIKVGD